MPFIYGTKSIIYLVVIATSSSNKINNIFIRAETSRIRNYTKDCPFDRDIYMSMRPFCIILFSIMVEEQSAR